MDGGWLATNGGGAGGAVTINDIILVKARHSITHRVSSAVGCVDPGDDGEKALPSIDGGQGVEEVVVEEDDADIPDMDGFEESDELADHDPVRPSSL